MEKRGPGATARITSMRNRTGPKSLDKQRTKAKMLPAQMKGCGADDDPFGCGLAETNSVLDPRCKLQESEVCEFARSR